MLGKSVAAVQTKRTVLVVEDDHDLRVMLRALLENEGYAVLTAAEGRAALVHLDTIVPDLILLDLRMPLMDGWELIAALRTRPELANVPIGLHTSEADRTLPTKVSFVLQKPVDARMLLARVREHLT